MSITAAPKAKTAHVNMMTDTIITNLPVEGLRAVLRSLLGSHPEITSSLEEETRKFIQEVALPAISTDTKLTMAGLVSKQKTIRCMLGCGLCYQSLPLIGDLAVQGAALLLESPGDEIDAVLASIDGDMVQAITAVQKSLFVISGSRSLSDDESDLVKDLLKALLDCKTSTEGKADFPYGRALFATASLLGSPEYVGASMEPAPWAQDLDKAPRAASETFEMNGRVLPRIFSGLWQLSSPAWGSASTSKIMSQFSKHVQSGFTAFDMADHYGDAEIIFGRFRSLYPRKDAIFAGTKYCVFHPMTVTKEAVRANVSERCQRLQVDKLDLLQFHWQFYNDPQYLDALRFLQEDERVGTLGLCNFDTEHMEKVLDQGISVHANQIQFSLIDSRPTVRMAEVCEKHNVKLLTYGTLCGGFLADKWLGKAEPDLYDSSITPSQRKYHGMIRAWGDWSLFQELLSTLDTIGKKHNVNISNVATRWVLDFGYVGAVIVGARMGVSEHTEDNLASFGWSLDQADRDSIEDILKRSRRLEMFEAMGDCGGEYR
ncbi:aldo/keto reductase [Xylariales sp. PMI_506]|nr:aldo/keto reductase [Xylariales sp. PMI_506]